MMLRAKGWVSSGFLVGLGLGYGLGSEWANPDESSSSASASASASGISVGGNPNRVSPLLGYPNTAVAA